MFASLRYLAARLRHRDDASGRYLRMGLGIERRSRRLAAFWGPHQRRTRGAQRRWDAGGGTLTVLGAGRLLDFDTVALAPRFDRLRLVDADPLSETCWRRIGAPYEAVFTDISGCVDRWVAELAGVRGDWAATLEAVRRIAAPPLAYAASTDALLSLNVLSQIPIGWQDGVERHLWRRFGRTYTAKRETEWLAAIDEGGRMLVEQHLAAIERSAPRFALVVTDLDYVEYSGRAYTVDRWAPEPLRWEPGGWIAEEGVRCQPWSALHGVDLESAETWRRWTPSYRLAWSDWWLWHIAPMGAECSQCGTVHRVGAFALERATDETETR